MAVYCGKCESYNSFYMGYRDIDAKCFFTIKDKLKNLKKESNPVYKERIIWFDKMHLADNCKEKTQTTIARIININSFYLKYRQ